MVQRTPARSVRATVSPFVASAGFVRAQSMCADPGPWQASQPTEISFQARVKRVCGGVVILAHVGRVAVGAHEIPVLRIPRPVQFIAVVDLIVRIEVEPALAAPRFRPSVPGDRQGLQPAVRKFNQVLLQRLDAERVLDLEVRQLPIGAIRVHEVPCRRAERRSTRRRRSETAPPRSHRGRSQAVAALHRPRVSRALPCGVGVAVAARRRPRCRRSGRQPSRAEPGRQPLAARQSAAARPQRRHQIPAVAAHQNGEKTSANPRPRGRGAAAFAARLRPRQGGAGGEGGGGRRLLRRDIGAHDQMTDGTHSATPRKSTHRGVFAQPRTLRDRADCCLKTQLN